LIFSAELMVVERLVEVSDAGNPSWSILIVSAIRLVSAGPVFSATLATFLGVSYATHPCVDAGSVRFRQYNAAAGRRTLAALKYA
jgi:hypothetical protein